MKKSVSICLALLMVLSAMSGLLWLVPLSATAEEGIQAAPYAYVPGLVAWYDGVQNTRAGADTNATVWEDLINGYDLPVQTDAKNKFTGEGFRLNTKKNYFPQEIVDLVNGDAFTVEIRFGEFISIGGDFNTFMNSSNDNFALFRRNASNVIEFKYYANAVASRPTIEDGLNKLQNALITVTYQAGGSCIIYINGEKAAERDCLQTMGADDLFIGQTGSKAYDALYKSIRFYNRELSAAEVAHNAAVDGYVNIASLYVQDGLVSLFSGVKNTKAGYASAATTWGDLVGSNDISLTLNDKNYFTREGFHLNSTRQYFPKAIVDLINGNEFTVEMALGDVESLGTAYNTFINSTNDAFSLFRRVSEDIIEYKFASNSRGERPTVENGLQAFANSTVTVTYHVGGNVSVYVDGILSAQVPCSRAMGADDLFFGHNLATHNFDTTYRALRFYDRALTAAEVKANAKVDGTYTETSTVVENPGYVTVAQPVTNIVGDVALVRPVNSAAELTAVAGADKKPAAAILSINKSLEVLDASGKKFTTVEEALKTLNYTVLPVFEISDKATADALVDLLKTMHFSDVFFMSQDPALVLYARKALPSARGIIDYTETYKDSTGLTTEQCVEIRKSMKANYGTIAILPQAAARKDAVQYLYDSIVNVWVKAPDKLTTVGAMDALLSGALGVISDDTATLLSAVSTLNATTMTRVPLNIGHRGMPDGNPENTVEGSLAAYNAGADVIEIDIYLTLDNEIVIMHDGSTGRTCNKDISVEGSTLAQLKELYVNRGFENVEGKNNWRIPTFREYLEAFQDKDCRLFIEIKSGKSEIVPLMKALIEEYDMYDQCAVITFSEGQMANMNKYFPEMSVGALCGGLMGEVNPDSDMRGVMSFIGKYNATLNPSYGGYGEKAIRAALIRGISIYPWTFAGSNYNSYFTWGYSGLTGNTASSLARLPKRFNVTGITDGDCVEVGTSLTPEASVLSYKREESSVNSKVQYIILEGADLVTLENGIMSFRGTGDVSFIACYENTRILTYTLYTQPITIHVGSSAAETTPDTGTDTDTETTEPATDPVTPTETDVPTDPTVTLPTTEPTPADSDTEAVSPAATTASETDSTDQSGCKSVIGGASLLFCMAAGAVVLKRKKHS